METSPPTGILDLAPAIDTLKSLSCKFRETGDYEYMMEILLIMVSLVMVSQMDLLI